MTDSFIAELNIKAKQFVEERGWNQFQTAKNLSMALIVEAAELVEHFQWMRPDESDALTTRKKVEVGDELADILIYTVRLADSLDINLEAAAYGKMNLKSTDAGFCSPRSANFGRKVRECCHVVTQQSRSR